MNNGHRSIQHANQPILSKGNHFFSVIPEMGDIWGQGVEG